MRFVAAFSLVGLISAAPAWPADAGAGSPIPAVWKEEHLSFRYMGRTSRYSCEGLRDKVRAMLLVVGARRDLGITALGCEEPAVQVLSIVFSAPALPSPKMRPLHAGDLAAVEARYETFTITSDAFRNMGVADCELVEEFAHQILPKLATRVLKQDISCVPFQESGGRFLIRGEILKALPG